MGTIAAGKITAFYLFDVADSIDLGSVQRLIASTVADPLYAEAAGAGVRSVS